MAYAAVDSLRRTIDYDISRDPGSREAFEFASNEVKSLKESVRRMFLSSRSSLDLEIGVAVSKLEDVIKSHLSKERIPKTICDKVEFSMELQDLKQAFHSTNVILKKMEEEYAKELSEDDAIPSRNVHNSKTVRSSPQYVELKRGLTRPDPTTGPIVFTLVGMPGIGKTTLAIEVFKDPDILEHFDCLAWVTVGSKYRFNEIGRCILAQVDPQSYRMLAGADEDCIARNLQDCLKGKRYLIVLDDVRNKYMAEHLHPLDFEERAQLKNPFPHEANEGRVLLTTRLQQVVRHRLFEHDVLTMRLLNKEESWDLLCEKVFGEKSKCPSVLEKDGEKIAEKCGGLPLTIVTVSDLLLKAEKTPEFWSEVAMKRNHQLFKDAYKQISKVLYSCYKDLTRVLKMCFLYMGIFPQNHEVPRSKIINMWNVDGFIQQNVPCPGALQCLEELVSNNLVMIYKSTVNPAYVWQKRIKTCGLHSSLWHLSIREGRKSKFCHVLDTYGDGFGEAIENQSRLSFHNNAMFCLKDVYESVEDNCALTTRSLLFYGPYHQYQVPICSRLKLLKELDALTIRFYEFPLEVLQLVELRYLALTVNGKLPASISQLSNLQFLIVGRHLSIKCCKKPSYLPVEIWDMKELKHLQVMGGNLPDPCGASLESLMTLTNVSAHSCTEGVLRAIPNLKKLGIQIELAPEGDGEPLSCFHHISHLEALTSLKCVVMNPRVVPALAPLSIFPSNLMKLSLSGMGYPWTELSKITSSLTRLMVLKLRNYAFRGEVWEVEKYGFHALHLLVIEDTDLVEWRIGHKSFYYLKRLRIKDCYKLKKIDGKLHMYKGEIEFIDCSPSHVEQMRVQMREQRREAKIWYFPKEVVHSSWELKK